MTVSINTSPLSGKDGKFLTGQISGYQLGGDSMAPMLLSQPAQESLGISKDARSGVTWIDGEEVQNLGPSTYVTPKNF